MEKHDLSLRWREIYALSALSAAVAFSWIAYHEYQPHLLEQFGFQDLGGFLTIAKALVLIIVPPVAGWLSDLLLRRTGKFMMVFSVGIGVTAMTFMAVATVLGFEAMAAIKGILPLLIVIWLIAMNMFTSPALSMLDGFAPSQKLPIAVAFLFFVTQMIYALEPILVNLVQFLGDTLTFIGGGILIASLGFLFQRVSSDEVAERRKSVLQSDAPQSRNATFTAILFVGFIFGTANAFLVEYVPAKAEVIYEASPLFANYFSFGLLAFAALLALSVGGIVAKRGARKLLPRFVQAVAVGLLLIILMEGRFLFTISCILLSTAFGLLSTTALPFAINNLSLRNMGLGVGVFIGASYLVEGLLEVLL